MSAARMRRPGRPEGPGTLVSSPCATDDGVHRLDKGIAKKRVHEIAKEKGISSKEVLAVLQKAGLDVKAAASSVDEADVARAFGNGAAAEEPAPAKDDEAAAASQSDGEPSGQGQAARGERPARARPTRAG